MNDELRRLGEAVRDSLGEGPSEQRLGMQRHAVLTRLVEPRKRGWRFGWIALTTSSAAAVATAIVFMMIARSEDDAPPASLRCHDGNGVELHAGEWLSANDGIVALRFTDRSEITVEPESRLRLESIAHDRVRVSLEEGRIASEVRSPNHSVDWTFLAGPFEVDVLGTALSIDWAPGAGRVVVEVYHGVVRVRRGADDQEGVRVRAGERFEASIDPGFVLSPIESPDRVPELETEHEQESLSPPAPAPPAPSTPRNVEARGNVEPWVRLARQGDYAEAFALARERGIESVIARGSARDVLLLADTARFAGEHDQARAILTALRDRFPGTPSAAMGAFRLGRLAFDRREYGDAVRWFSTYRREAPSGELADQAHGRELEALLRSGQRASAREVARAYLAAHPHGPYHDLANHALGPEPP